MSARRSVAVIVLLAAALSGVAHAQESSDWTQLPLVRTTRVGLGASVSLDQPRTWSTGGLFAPFISENWQVGVAPRYYGYQVYGAPSGHLIQVAALANYHVGSNRRSRAYVGGYAEAFGGTRTSGAAWYGAQLGWNHFLSPFTAVRAELAYRLRLGAQQDWQEFTDRLDLIVTLDPYMRGRAARDELTPAAFGTLDIALTAQAHLRPDRRYYVNAMLAPFLSRWLQVGGEIGYTYVPATGVWRGEASAITTLVRTGLARVYAPIGVRAMPFIGGVLESSTYPGGGVSSRRLLGGIRGQLGPRAALDVSLNWRRYSELVSAATATRYRPPDELGLRAQIITQVRRGR